MKLRYRLTPYLFILASFVLIAMFYYYPVGYAIYSSFTDMEWGVEKVNFVGIQNYLDAFKDDYFVQGLRNQVIFLLTDIFKAVFFPLLGVELIFFIRRDAIKELFKKLFVLPIIVPGMVGVMMWLNMYDPSFGAFNNLLDAIGLGALKHAWLKEEATALWAIILMGFPFISGINFLLFFAGLVNISGEFQAAAMIDGCTKMKLIRYIHLPLLIPYLSVVVILTCIGSLQDYIRVLVTTKGFFGTYVPALRMVDTAFTSQKIGAASAMGVMIFVVIILLSVFSMRAAKQN